MELFEIILAWLFWIFTLLFLIALKKPSLVIRWGNEEKDKKQALKRYYISGVFIILWSLISADVLIDYGIIGLLFCIPFLIFLFSILCLIFGFKNPKLVKQESKKDVMKVFGILLSITSLIMGGAVSYYENNIDLVEQEINETITIDKERETSVQFLEIKKKKENMTESQINNYVENIKGELVVWEGDIIDIIEQNSSDDYEVWVNIECPDENVIIPNVYLKNIPKDIAIETDKGEEIKFKGYINSVDNIFIGIRVKLEEVEII